MESGFLNQKIEVFKYADVDDGAGGVTPQEVLYWSTSAHVEQLRSSRTLEANQERLKPVLKFKVRYRDDKFVIEDMIIKWRGEVFRVNQCTPDFIYKEYVEILAVSTTLPTR